MVLRGESEEERLRNDAAARNRMMDHMRAVEEAEARGETGDRGAWKWAIRKRIWDHMEANDIAAAPRPVHHRIPNFVGAELTASQVEQLPEFRRAKCVKVNPDRPQAPVRLATLRAGKLLLVPQPRLRTGFFSVLDPTKIDPSLYSLAVTQQGVVRFGEPVDLDEKMKIDLIVIGSVAVDAASGCRLGKGEGFAELEYGMLRLMEAIDDDTPVVTCIHDCQLVDDIPVDRMLCHDVPVDIICTPTRTIRLQPLLPKPKGIYWDKLSPQKLGSIRILQKLKAKLERDLGEQLPSGPDEILPPTAVRSGKGDGKQGKGKGKGRGKAAPQAEEVFAHSAASSQAPGGKGMRKGEQARWVRKADAGAHSVPEERAASGSEQRARRWRPKAAPADASG